MRRHHRRQQAAIFLVDLLLMYVSLILALIIRNGVFPSAWTLREHGIHFSVIFVGWILVFYTIGMYRLEHPFDDFHFLQRTVMGATVAGLASAGYFYLLPSVPIEPKTVLFLFVVLYTALFWLWRYSLGKLRRVEVLRVGVGFVGLRPESFGIIHETIARSSLGYDIRFVYGAPEGVNLPAGIRSVHKIGHIRQAVESTESDLIVLGEYNILPPELLRVLFGLLDRKVRFIQLPEFYELVVRRVPVGLIDATWFLENIDLRNKKGYEIVKRGLDILLALAVFLVTVPFWPFVALAVKLSSPGPVFFRQTRVGRFDRPFTIYKFRTMRVLGNNHEPTGRDDPRVTPTGAFLRSSRLDEIPQVLNILKGDMSFVGPRPERPDIAVTLEKEIPFYRQRHLVKPGATGWDQVSGEYHSPSIEDSYQKLQYDLYYLKNMSIYLDISIFFRTILTVLRREGR